MNRDEFAQCPRCKAALDATGDRLVCKACGGILIAEPEVSKLIADMLGTTLSMLGWHSSTAEPQPLKLTDRPADGDAPTCPRCTAAMQPRGLYGIKVDRCDAHGIWFDREELEQTLRAAGTAEKPRSGLGEKVFTGALVAAYVAGAILQFILA